MSSREIIVSLLKARPIDVDALGKALDAVDHETRMAVLPAFSRRIQRHLYTAAADRAVTLNDMVPADKGPLEEVIHEGINTLPGFRFFQKRFCLPTEPEQANEIMLWGYNHQEMSVVTGPGYFVSYEHTPTGEFWIDYRQIPPERPASWPKIADNKHKLGRFVYAGMVDKMRKVSEHVTVGRAYRNKPMSAWFVLVRKP